MKTNERPQFRDCPVCGAGGIIPDERGNCTHCGSNIESPTATAEHVEREGTKDATQHAPSRRLRKRAQEPFMVISSCPYCSSNNIKKNFLAVPPVFGISSATISILLIVSGLITILVGLSNLVSTQTIQVGPDTYAVAEEEDAWAIATEVIVGTVVVLIAIMGLSRRNYTCWSCGKRFFTPSEISKEDPGQSKSVEIKPQLSSLAVFSLVLFPIPFIGLPMAIVSVRRISKSEGQLYGKTLARVSLVINCLCLALATFGMIMGTIMASSGK